MKAPSRTFAFVILAAIVTLAVVSCVSHQFVANQQALLIIGSGTANQTTTYVRWKSQKKFDDALAEVCANRQGEYDITVLMDDRASPIPHYSPCPHSRSIRLVKVTKSKIVAPAAAGDPHVTMSVASSDPADIAVVAAALKR